MTTFSVNQPQTRPPLELRQHIKEQLDALPDRLLLPIAESVDELESVQATRELLEIPGILESHQEGLKDMDESRGTPWGEVRQDV